MTYLGTVSGTGRLLASGNDLGEVEYEISGYQPRYLKEFTGTISAHWKPLRAAFDARKAVLVLEDGHEVPILVTSVDIETGTAAIHVNAVVPGL